MKQQVSAMARLQSLPAIFRGADLTVRFYWDSKTASQYLYLWRRRGLVLGLGGHSDVYANLLTAASPNWEKALLVAMPSAVTIGIEALRQTGWTTQVPSLPTVAVNKRERVYTVDHFDVTPRDASWFATVRTGVDRERTKGTSGGLPALRPAWALADMLRSQPWGECGLWPDDIEWEQVAIDDEADWIAACAAFGLEHIPLAEQEVASR